MGEIKEEVETIADVIIVEMIEDLETIENLKKITRKKSKTFLIINLESPKFFWRFFYLHTTDML